MGTVPAGARHDLTDAQWDVLEPLLPAMSGRGRPPKWTKRQLIDGVRWRTRAGTPWRDVPERYGSWQSIYGLFRQWQREDIWAQILAALHQLGDAMKMIGWDVSVDSTIVRAHQHAAGARRHPERQVEPPSADPGVVEPVDHGLGRSRGGWTTKLHLAAEQGRKPLSLVITGGQRGDSPQFVTVLERIRVGRVGPGRPRSRPDRVLADKAYSSRAKRLRRRRDRRGARRGELKNGACSASTPPRAPVKLR
ncbi:IS5 family transposase [Pseudonocardia sp. GCM10023141]|uniref:IS5 family transposase n=1 Tax=Pseudonocardia sp. GCM10023141 TaxID=3252653 RepID=UPI00361247A5